LGPNRIGLCRAFHGPDAPYSQNSGTGASFASLGFFSGAIGTHLFTPEGIVVQWGGNSDNGQLFFMAVLSLVFIVVHLFLYSKEKNYSLKELINKEVLKK